jgi:hypothetical protein
MLAFRDILRFRHGYSSTNTSTLLISCNKLKTSANNNKNDDDDDDDDTTTTTIRHTITWGCLTKLKVCNNRQLLYNSNPACTLHTRSHIAKTGKFEAVSAGTRTNVTSRHVMSLHAKHHCNFQPDQPLYIQNFSSTIVTLSLISVLQENQTEDKCFRTAQNKKNHHFTLNPEFRQL